MYFYENLFQKFPFLSDLAKDILSIPSSTAFIERGFSAAGIASAGRRGLIGPKALENEVFLKVNSHRIDPE